MRSVELRWPSTAVVSSLAALTTWVTLLAWTKFAERPSGFMVPVLAACILVAVSGMLLRSARLPAVLVVLAQLLLLAAWLHHSWAGAQALGGWIPTGDSLRQVGITVREASAAAQAYAAPVPKSVPQFYPVMVLVGSATAVLIDFIAVGLRRAPLAGLPLLALYTAPVTILDGGVSWVKFALAAVCFLFLIAGEQAQRLAQWGHQLSSSRLFDSQTTRASTQPVWASARKIGLTATGLAVVVPLLVPTFSGTLFDGNGDGPGGNGDAVTISNPMVDMRRDLTRGLDVELVRVTTPDPDPSYLRLTVLDAYDGSSWRPSGRSIPVAQRADGLVPRPPGLDAGVATKHVSYSIQDSGYFKSRWLPTPYPVYSIRAPGDWRYDQSTLDFISAAGGQTAAGVSYSLEALQVSPTAVQLAGSGPAPASVFGPATALPKGFPDSVRELARSVTADGATKFEKAVELQQWFRVGGGFTYSLQRAPGDGLDELVHFLGEGPDSRTGYCEQFAAAMAVMGRAVGIPSRVAVGFLRPQQIGHDTYVFSSHDLHAWPEMYFQGVGWVRFEPTPEDRTGATPGYTRQRLPQVLPQDTPSSTRALPTQNRVDQPSVAPGAGGGSSSGHGPAALTVVFSAAGALLLLLLLGLPRLARGWIRRRRWSAVAAPAELAEAAWAELRDTATDLGIAWDDRVTLRTRARELVRSFALPGAEDDAITRAPVRGAAADPEASAALDRLVRLLERARYARVVPESGDPVGWAESVRAVRTDVERCVQSLRAGASRGQRSRARWVPVSVFSAAARGWSPGDRRLRVEPGVDHAV
jgi:transglutaminase-like putative cysteine protease